MIVITKLLSRASDSESCSVVSDSLGPEQNTGVGSHSLLQGMFLTQGLNPDLPHCSWILYRLSHLLVSDVVYKRSGFSLFSLSKSLYNFPLYIYNIIYIMNFYYLFKNYTIDRHLDEQSFAFILAKCCSEHPSHRPLYATISYRYCLSQKTCHLQCYFYRKSGFHICLNLSSASLFCFHRQLTLFLCKYVT